MSNKNQADEKKIPVEYTKEEKAAWLIQKDAHRVSQLVEVGYKEEVALTLKEYVRTHRGYETFEATDENGVTKKAFRRSERHLGDKLIRWISWMPKTCKNARNFTHNVVEDLMVDLKELRAACNQGEAVAFECFINQKTKRNAVTFIVSAMNNCVANFGQFVYLVDGVMHMLTVHPDALDFCTHRDTYVPESDNHPASVKQSESLGTLDDLKVGLVPRPNTVRNERATSIKKPKVSTKACNIVLNGEQSNKGVTLSSFAALDVVGDTIVVKDTDVK